MRVQGGADGYRPIVSLQVVHVCLCCAETVLPRAAVTRITPQGAMIQISAKQNKWKCM